MTGVRKMNMSSLDIAREKRMEIEQCLRGSFPEVFPESGIDFDQLRRVLGGWIDPSKERFGMSWPGKAECMKILQQPSLATLKPARKDSLDFDAAQNIFIEGDNLEVIKLLQKAYFGKIKVIFIDPPYNTGNEFIYPDRFSETLKTYLSYTGQLDDEGQKFSTNTDSAGRFHSRWLNMMYPRLYLARNLMREDGAIFVSIDDGEVANLRKISDEIFGEENFVANVVWQKKYTRANDARWFSDNHDHILVYAKNKEEFTINGLARSEDQRRSYSNPDNHSKGPWKATPLHAKSGTNTSAYTFSNGVVWGPPRGTFRRFNDEAMHRMDEGGEIWFGSNGQQIPSRKSFLSEVKEGVTPTTLWTYQEAGHNHEASNDLKALGMGGAFDNPKPVRLIKRILSLATSPTEEHIVLDFFAGSGTTAHAVLDQNKEDGGNRRFICVQLPEHIEDGREVDSKSYKKISDLTVERIRRAAERLSVTTEGLLDLTGKAALDCGVKIFRLDSSNFRVWEVESAEEIDTQIEMHIDHLLKSSGPEEVLYELLLKAGFPLTTKVQTVEMAGKLIFSIEDDLLLICLEKEITSELIDALAEADPLQVICLDEGFKGNDQLKANAVQTFKARAASRETEIVFRTV